MSYRGVAALAIAAQLLAGPSRALAHDVSAAAKRKPYSVCAEVGGAYGVNFPSLLRASLVVNRTFVDRFEIGVGMRFGTASDALLLEPGARAVVLFHLAGMLDLQVGWWVGYARVSKELPNGRLGLDMFNTTALLAVTYRLSHRFELRATPLAISGYLSDGIWAFTVEPSAGMAVRF
ncbi:MAG: hypothetical protein KC503_03715 [Myxococcales bacterium]|nr:hypothetical protein [Myxococcales bacterium]